MRITQSNKRLAWFLGFQNRSRNRVFRVFLNWNLEKALTFSHFNLDRPLRYFSEKIFISWQSKLANFQQCIFWKNILLKDFFQNKTVLLFLGVSNNSDLWLRFLTKNFYVIKRKFSSYILSLSLTKSSPYYI